MILPSVRKRKISIIATMKHNVSGIIIIVLLLQKVQSKECESGQIKVHTKTSTYIGCEIYNWKSEKCRAFRGISYARPPIEELRFKDPIPVEYNSNSNIIDARDNGNDCPSIFTDNASEDCLYLNVYSKNLENSTMTLPVVVFIHPGGFYGGSGASTFLGPEYLLDRNIILVTFNYRLASLGFLNLGTAEVPGNAGLKDQVMALRWTRDNIRYFGGDPNNVSLMGYSAGAMSVCLHLVSPMSQGLFNKAIIMSGSIPPQTTIPRYHQIELARKQALIMGCEIPLSSSPNDIMQCLNKFSGLEIASTLRRMFAYGKDNPIFLWLPVIEQNFGQERFLTEDPYVSLKESRFAKVPLLTGFTNGEFCTSAKEIIANESLLNKFNNEFESLGPVCFMYSQHSRENSITKAIRSHYFHNGTVAEDKFKQLCDLFSDSLIRFGTSQIGRLTSKHVNVYPYRFSYKGRSSYLRYPGYNGAEHMDDLMYIFKMPLETFSPSDPEAAVVQLLINFFAEFIINGKPQQDFEYKANKFAEIHASIDIRDGSNFEQYSFWNGLIEL